MIFFHGKKYPVSEKRQVALQGYYLSIKCFSIDYKTYHLVIEILYQLLELMYSHSTTFYFSIYL
jgi:hypothetical protein